MAHLVFARKVSVSTRKQDLNTQSFLFGNVAGNEIGDLGDFARARRPKKLPVVLNRQEVGMHPEAPAGRSALAAELLYRSGLRLMECLRQRVRDIDLEGLPIVVRGAKGGRERVTVLAGSSRRRLAEHLTKVRRLYEEDLAFPFKGATLPFGTGGIRAGAPWSGPGSTSFTSAAAL